MNAINTIGKPVRVLGVALNDAGNVVVELADSRGKFRQYTVELDSEHRFRLSRPGKSYTVWECLGGLWACTCAAFQFGGGRDCKHIGAARILAAVMLQGRELYGNTDG